MTDSTSQTQADAPTSKESKAVIDRQTNAMANLKLKRITEVNSRLKEDLSRERIFASNACLSIIRHTQNTKDLGIPTLWGYFDDEDSEYEQKKGSVSCCIIS